jgi:hypothetical protein
MLQVTVEPAAAQADTAPLANPDESADVSLPEAETQADAAR